MSTSTPLNTILDAADWNDAPREWLGMRSVEQVLPTVLPIEAIATATLQATGLAAAWIWRSRGGRDQTVIVDFQAAGLGMSSADYLQVDGKKIDRWDPITGFYETNDGWVYLHGNFPHLRDGLLELFGVPNDHDAMAAAMAKLPGADIEGRAAERGLCAAIVRDRKTWAAHRQGQAIAALPLIDITRIGDADPMPWQVAARMPARPLSGLRVLDLTRVIAGPMAGRTLAEHGATVMRVAGPHLPFVESLVINTGHGKRSCYIDLREEDGRKTLEKLIADSDILLNAYRPGALDALGFGPERLAELQPGIVSVSLSAFSNAGPWSARRGYDSLVQGACGLALADGGATPKRLPCQPLDYLTGYLAAFGAMVGLMRRAKDGGSWHIDLSLARIAEWMWQMSDVLGPKARIPEALPDREKVAHLLQKMESDFGSLQFLKSATTMSMTPPRFERPPVPLGTDPARWP